MEKVNVHAEKMPVFSPATLCSKFLHQEPEEKCLFCISVFVHMGQRHLLSSFVYTSIYDFGFCLVCKGTLSSVNFFNFICISLIHNRYCQKR